MRVLREGLEQEGTGRGNPEAANEGRRVIGRQQEDGTRLQTTDQRDQGHTPDGASSRTQTG
jgi:hypothetical protein